MDETKVLEHALHTCHKLERSIYESIRLVRRLNIRYNSDWLLKNYKNYMANIWSQYQCSSNTKLSATATARSATSVRSLPVAALTHSKLAAARPKSAMLQSRSSISLALSARSSHELCGISRQINYKFIKIKRSMEALMHQIQHVIELANRQRNFIHLNVIGRDQRTRVCCH